MGLVESQTQEPLLSDTQMKRLERQTVETRGGRAVASGCELGWERKGLEVSLVVLVG